MNEMLRGYTVGITADRRWDEQAALFERRGATVFHGPTIRTLPLGADDGLREATETVIVRRPAAVLANTGLGIRSWFSAAETWGLGAQLGAVLSESRIYARGPKASGAVHAVGLDVVSRARSERLREAVDQVLTDLRPGDVVAFQADGAGASPEVERLSAAGADVIHVPVYEWKLPADERPAVRLAEAVIAGRVHAVTFTANPAIGNWLAIAAEHGIADALREALTEGHVVVGCVGPVCADAAARHGIGSDHLVVPDTWRIGPLVRAVEERLVERIFQFTLNGSEVRVAGRVGTIDGEPFTMSDVEARLLSQLARPPNVVRSKAALLRDVWGAEAVDPHVVEVTIARLRRRLGDRGRAIASVHRRGYVLAASDDAPPAPEG